MRGVPVLVSRVVLATLLLAHVAASRAQTPAPVENVSTLPPRSPEDERKALHLPPGFEIQLVASEPDIHKPLNLAFDDRGRLWVTDTVEYPYPASRRGRRRRDTVKILSDFRPDGRAGKIQTFADGLNIPIGLLPYPSGREAIVHNIPNIYLMRDTDGDGQADTPRGPLRRLRLPRHPRHDQRLLLGLRRLDLRLPRLLQHLERPGEGPPADPDAVGQHLPDAARRLARRVLHARAGQPVRPGVRPDGQPVLLRLPQPADLSAPPGRLVPELRQARRRPRVRPRDGHPRPRLDRDRAASATTRPTSSPRRTAAPSSSATSSPTGSTTTGSSGTGPPPRGSSSPISSGARTTGSAPSTSSWVPTVPSTSPTSTTGSSAITRCP